MRGDMHGVPGAKRKRCGKSLEADCVDMQETPGEYANDAAYTEKNGDDSDDRKYIHGNPGAIGSDAGKQHYGKETRYFTDRISELSPNNQ